MIGRALPSPVGGDGEMHGRVPAPLVTDTERLVADVWRSALGIDVIGADDDFFALGGHSLLAMRASASLAANLDVDLDANDVFAHRTVRRYAAAISDVATHAGGPDTYTGSLILLQPSAEQRRLVFLAELDPTSDAYNVSYVFTPPHRVDDGALKRALERLVRRHDVLRSLFTTEARVPRMDTQAPLRVDDVTDAGDLSQLWSAELSRPFNLRRDDLVRAALYRADEGDFLQLTFHHVAIDAWSAEVTVTELESLYERELSGSPTELLEAPDYSPYVARQLRWRESAARVASAEFWARYLNGVDLAVALPAPKGCTPECGEMPRVVHELIHLQGDLTRRLDDFARKRQLTTFELLAAAYATALSRLAAQPEVGVAVGFADRRSAEEQRTVGLMLNTLPLRVRVRAMQSLAEIASAIRSNLTEIRRHIQMPFEDAVSEAVRSRRTDAAIDAAFAYQGDLAPRWAEERAPAVELLPRTPRFPIVFVAGTRADSIVGRVELDASLFDPSVASEVAATIADLLADAVEDDSRAVALAPRARAAVAIGTGVAAAAVRLATPTERDLVLDWERDPASTIYSLGVSVALPPDVAIDRWERALGRALADVSASRDRVRAFPRRCVRRLSCRS